MYKYIYISILDCQHVDYIIVLLYLVLMLVLYCSCRTLHTSPKSEPCTFGFPSVGSSAFASCSLEHLDHIVVFPYHSRVHHHLCCSRTFFFKSWEVLKFRFFRHIHAYMSFRYRISLSVSTVHTYLKFTLDIYLIPYPFLTATHTHTQKKKKSSPAPQTTFGTLRLLRVLKGRCKRVGGCGVISWVGVSPHLKSATLN